MSHHGGAVNMKPASVSEATRERETFKYYPYLLSSFRYASDGNRPPSSELTTSPDPVLASLAQLALLQTGAERAFVSLFDSTHQYVLVEVTPDIRIKPDLSAKDSSATLALRGVAIPRSQGTCDHVLFLQTGSGATDSDLADIPLSIVRNLGTDARFTSRPYCQFGDGGQFYAGVPIRTKRNIAIGAYCVMSQVQPENWNDQSVQRLRDTSHAIMDLLEARRCSYESRKHQRMNRGLGSFIEGRGTIGGWQSGVNVDAFLDNGQREGVLNAQQQHHEAKNEGQHPAGDDWQIDRSLNDTRGYFDFTRREQPRPEPGSHPFSSSINPTSQEADLPLSFEASPSPSEDDSHRVFSKAANIIRESFEVEGCVFLDVAFGSYKQPRPSDSGDNGGGRLTNEIMSSSSSDEHTFFNPSKARDAPSAVIGFSATDASSINSPKTTSSNIGMMPGWFLAKLLRRYRNGRIFNFDDDGMLQSSDSSGDDTEGSITRLRKTADVSSSEPSHTGKRSTRRLKEGALIHQAFPSARSVAFVPVWDTKRERWFAGGFIYTNVPTRVFSVHGELSFLAAFAKLIAAEVLNLETIQADKAKSDALGSLSHELRSPLHGAILSTELLNDTELSVFQGNATHTIEICCRTLLDTIEHLLDYAKVNSFAADEKQSRGSRQRHNRERDMPPHHQFGKKSLHKLIRLDRLVEEVTESVYAGFSFQNMSSAQLDSQNATSNDTFNAARRALDGDAEMEQLIQNELHFSFGNVAVYISVESGDWMFHIQPGAFRRVVLNLVGNALKYTTSGTIRVSLSQQRAVRSPAERLIKLSVQDTGKGISEEYLRNRLFKPFSQEDELMPGTGLGLSLVRKIVSQLRGKVAVSSRVGTGTTISVTLPLYQESRTAESPLVLTNEDQIFEDQVRELAGLRVVIHGFGSEWGEKGYEYVNDICSRWLRMHVVTDESVIPDVVIRTDDSMPKSLEAISHRSRAPNVIVCRHAPSAWELYSEFEHVDRNRILEFMSQPIGPRILARSVLRAYHRWVDLPKLVPKSRPAVLQRIRSSYNDAHLPVRPKTPPIPAPDLSPHTVADQTQGDIATAAPTTTDTPNSQPLEQEQPNHSQSDYKICKKYLVVDDNHINLKVLSAYMKKLGHTYTTATNGQEAVDAYVQDPQSFTGILMDISMPVMDGLEATRQIRSYERKKQLPYVEILALTGLSSHQTHQEALDSGVDVFLTKPVDFKTLTGVLAPKS